MAIKTVTVCDICGAVLAGADACRFGPVRVGNSYDGNRNEEDDVSLDLCREHVGNLELILDAVTGKNAHGITRIINQQQAAAVICLAIKAGFFQAMRREA